MFDEDYEVEVTVTDEYNSEEYLDFSVDRCGHGAQDIRDRLQQEIENIRSDNGENSYRLDIDIHNKDDITDYSSFYITNIKANDIFEVQNMFDMIEE